MYEVATKTPDDQESCSLSIYAGASRSPCAENCVKHVNPTRLSTFIFDATFDLL